METRINNPIMKRLAMLLVPFLTVGALTVAAQADDRVAKIQGRGTADMVASDDTFFPVNGIPTADQAYPINTEFKDNHFAIKAKVDANGFATGTAWARDRGQPASAGSRAPCSPRAGSGSA